MRPARGKKGFGSIRDIILALLLIAILLAMTGRIALLSKEKSGFDRCLSSVTINSQVEKMSIGALGSGIDCPAPFNKYKGDNQLSGLSDDILRCWRKTGSGSLQVFGKKFLSSKKDTPGCIVCSRFVLEKDIKLDDLVEYLSHENAPPDFKKKYSELLNLPLANMELVNPSTGKKELLGMKALFLMLGEGSLKAEEDGKPVVYTILYERAQPSTIQNFLDKTVIGRAILSTPAIGDTINVLRGIIHLFKKDNSALSTLAKENNLQGLGIQSVFIIRDNGIFQQYCSPLVDKPKKEYYDFLEGK